MTLLFRSRFNEPDPRWQRRVVDAHISSAADCATVRRGHLNLDVKSSPLRSGHIWTPDFSFTYGHAEARMRFLSPHGAHSAFWLQGVDYSPGNSEVDVVEHFGGNPLWHNVYWRDAGVDYGPDDYEKAKIRSRVVDPREWHVYGVEWTSGRYTFTVDDKAVAHITAGLSDKPKHLILSMLVSDWERPRFDPTARYRTQVDYVKVDQ